MFGVMLAAPFHGSAEVTREGTCPKKHLGLWRPFLSAGTLHPKALKVPISRPSGLLSVRACAPAPPCWLSVLVLHAFEPRAALCQVGPGETGALAGQLVRPDVVA